MNPAIHMNNEFVNFGYSESQTTTESYALHCHSSYELYYFLECDIDYLVEGKRYRPTPGSLLLLSPQVFHGVRINSPKPYKRFSVHFHPDILSGPCKGLLLSVFPSAASPQDREIYFEQTEYFHIQNYLEALEDFAALNAAADSAVGSAARSSLAADATLTADDISQEKMQLLSIRIEALLSQIYFMSQADRSRAKASSIDTVFRIIEYLNGHLTDNITLDLISERFFISKHHLNKVFRKATGTTVLDYLLHKRVAAAQQLLLRGSGAQEAAFSSGFRDYSAFYRAYTRILGHSPASDQGILQPKNDETRLQFAPLQAPMGN